MFILDIFRPSMPQRQTPGALRPGYTTSPQTIRVLPSFQGGVFRPGFTYNTATDQFTSGNPFMFGGYGNEYNPYEYGNGYGYNPYGYNTGYGLGYGNGYGNGFNRMMNPYGYGVGYGNGFNGMMNPYTYNTGLPYYYQNQFPQYGMNLYQRPVTMYDYMLFNRGVPMYTRSPNGAFNFLQVDPWMNGPQLQNMLRNIFPGSFI